MWVYYSVLGSDVLWLNLEGKDIAYVWSNIAFAGVVMNVISMWPCQKEIKLKRKKMMITELYKNHWVSESDDQLASPPYVLFSKNLWELELCLWEIFAEMKRDCTKFSTTLYTVNLAKPVENGIINLLSAICLVSSRLDSHFLWPLKVWRTPSSVN